MALGPQGQHRWTKGSRSSPLPRTQTFTSPLRTHLSPYLPVFSLPDKRPVTSSSFTGFQPSLLARRDSSLKRLTRWGSQSSRASSFNSSEQQKSLNGGDETPVLTSTSQEDKLDPAPEN